MYTYRLTASARNDLKEIKAYIQDKLMAPESAKRLMQAFEQAFSNACLHPKRLPPVTDSRLFTQGYRKIIVKNYVAFVLIDDANQFVDIMRVLYYARNYEKLL